MKISSTAANTITSRLKDVATKIKLIGEQENYDTPNNPDPNDTTTVAWVSDVLSSGVFVNNSASLSLDEDLIFTVNFPSGTKEIRVESAQLISATDDLLATADIDGNVTYSGQGLFTLTDFTLLFNFDFI